MKNLAHDYEFGRCNIHTTASSTFRHREYAGERFQRHDARRTCGRPGRCRKTAERPRQAETGVEMMHRLPCRDGTSDVEKTIQRSRTSGGLF
jgi:hypothetical protein